MRRWSKQSGTGGMPPGERNLCFAVLDDALRVVLHLTPAAPRLRQDALAWLVADEWEWPLSFRRVCEALDLDAAAIRRSVAGMLAANDHPSNPRDAP